MSNVACVMHASSPTRPALHDGLPYPCITRPSGVLSTAGFAYMQRREAGQYLQALVEQCRRRYVYSCRVTGAPDPSFGSGPLIINLTALMYPWDRLCCWYRETVFRRQMDLFECPYQSELTRWRDLIADRCFEPIYDDPQRVRLLLATVDLIPAINVDYELYDEDGNDINEPIFGWAAADHNRRAWGT